MVDTLARLADRPQLDVQVIRRGRATVASAGGVPERPMEFAFLHMPDAPLEPVSGIVRVAASEARSPRIRVENRSNREIRYFEIGWVIRDRQGREFLAGSVPASEGGVETRAGSAGEVSDAAVLRFTSRPGQPVAIDGMTGFVSQVEFSDGNIWIPTRASLDDARVRAAVAPSAEEQRLADLYRKRGLASLVAELKKY